ncbi:hypothetical protein QBC36DRAFT_11970 [Triangularia setosa]|uniref:C2H2-type domain-containing protein n=1 Tax=Triangularia setosa TaxID=2587417 RepID=A0AAN6W765_9PEZI|nr:hypothetical protein QBC36DRAFT_11970 [Podospora setosa]
MPICSHRLVSIAPGLELASPQMLSSPQLSKGGSEGLESLEKVEQRVQALESLIHELEISLKGHLEAEHLCTHSTQGPAQAECQSRRSAISRCKRLLKRALALFLPYRSRSHKSQTLSEYSSSLHTESTRRRVLNWIPRPSPSTPGKPLFGEGNGSILHSAVLEQIEVNIYQPSAMVEAMNNEVRKPVELSDNSCPAELAGNFRTPHIFSPQLLDSASLSYNAGAPFSAGSNISPLSGSIISRTPQTVSSNYSPSSIRTPLSSIPNGSPSDYDKLNPLSLYPHQQTSKESFWAQASVTGRQSTALYIENSSPTIPLSLGVSAQYGMPCFADLPPARHESVTYLADQLWNPPSNVSRFSDIRMEVDHTVTGGENFPWNDKDAPVPTNLSPFDHNHQIWDSSGIVGNQYVSDPHCLGISITTPLSATMPGANEEYPAQESNVADGSATMQVAGQTPMIGCYHCQFFPDPGPDQKKKLEKHLRTITHLRKTGQGTVHRYKCRDCGTAYTRKDNLVQHQKVHTGSGPSQAGRKRFKVSRGKRRRQASVVGDDA